MEVFIMNKMLTTITLLGCMLFALVGCETDLEEPKASQGTSKTETKKVITQEYLKEIDQWMFTVLNNRTALLKHAQFNTEECQKALDTMKTAENVIPAMKAEGYDTRAEILQLIFDAQEDLRKYIDEGDSTAFSRAASKLNKGVELFESMR